MGEARIFADRVALRDLTLYGASAVHAFLLSLFPVHSIYRSWGRMAVWSYLGAVLVAALFAIRTRAGAVSRRAPGALAIAVLIGAVILPMAQQIKLRSEGSGSRHAQSHTIITEEAAKALVGGENPYATDYLDGPLASWDLGVKTHFPYMPAMTLFGLPRALLGSGPFTDARVAFTVVGLGVLAAALALWSTSLDRKLLALQVAVVLPTGAVFFSGGAHEFPVLALMLLSLILLDRRRFAASGVALGAASAFKQTAWFLIPFLLIAAFRQERRAIASSLAIASVVVPLTLVFLLWDAAAFIEDAVRFPLDLGRQKTIARAPTLGSLVVEAWPSAKPWLPLVMGALVMVIVLVVVLRRGSDSAARASFHAGIVFTVVMLLSPAGRPGYALYPVNLLLWAWLLRPKGSRAVISPGRSAGI